MKLYWFYIVSITSALLTTLNFVLWEQTVFGTVVFGLYLLSAALILRHLLPHSQKSTFNHSLGIATLLLLCYFSIVGGTVYYLYQLNHLAVALILALPTVAYVITGWSRRFDQIKLKISISWQESGGGHVLALAYAASAATCFWVISRVTITEAVASPWHAIPLYFFGIYLVATLLLILYIALAQTRLYALPLIMTHYGISLGIAFIIYKIGYGYDPFIHQATEKTILEEGQILPKQLYYLGHYSLVTILSKATAISHLFWDKTMVALITALFLPYTLFQSLQTLQLHKKYALLGTLAFLIFPFPFLINTTPQSLAMVFTLLTIFTALMHLRSGVSIWLPAVLSATALAIHPLAGIPGFILIGLLALKKFKRSLLPIWAVISSFLIPLAFVVNARLSDFQLAFSFEGLTEGLTLLNLYKLHHPIRDLIYLYGFNSSLIVIIAGLAFSLYRIYAKQEQYWKHFLIAAVIIGLNYIITKYFLVFGDLITYERGDFAQRLLFIIQCFFYPVIIYSLAGFARDVKRKAPLAMRVFFLLLCGSLISASLYLSYPRWDHYQANQGYNVSAADFEAVKIIDKQATTPNYAVLAPQTSSAAAVTVHGFDQQRNGQYFYPIPTGGPLYRLFLQTIENPLDTTSIEEAKSLTGSTEIFVIIPSYWSDFARRVDQHSQVAGRRYQTSNQEIIIFHYLP